MVIENATARQKFDTAATLYKQGSVAEALDILRELQRNTPENRELLYASALCLIALGRDSEALPFVERLKTVYADPRADKLRGQLICEGAALSPATHRNSNSTSRSMKREVQIGDVVTFPCGTVWGALRVISDHEGKSGKFVIAVSTWFSKERVYQLPKSTNPLGKVFGLLDSHLFQVFGHQLDPEDPALYLISRKEQLPESCAVIGYCKPFYDDKALYAKFIQSFLYNGKLDQLDKYNATFDEILSDIRKEYDLWFGESREARLRLKARRSTLKEIAKQRAAQRVAEEKRQSAINTAEIEFPYGCPSCAGGDRQHYRVVLSGFPTSYVCSTCNKKWSIERDSETRFIWKWNGGGRYGLHFQVSSCGECDTSLSYYTIYANSTAGSCLQCGVGFAEEATYG